MERGENTLGFFESSRKLGTNMLEIDVKLTKDKKVVIFHDDDLSRVSGTSKAIEDFNYAEFAPL